jgi:hypothetical protein
MWIRRGMAVGPREDAGKPRENRGGQSLGLFARWQKGSRLGEEPAFDS